MFFRADVTFFERPDIGFVADGSHHGEGKHDAGQTVPAPAGGQERVSLWSRPSSFLAASKCPHGPAMALHRYLHLHGRALGNTTWRRRRNLLSPMLRLSTTGASDSPLRILSYC